MMRTNHPRSEFGIRKADLFNERFALGQLVAVRRMPGEPATWDRVYAPAYGGGDAAFVELASSLVPVDTDVVFEFDTGAAEHLDVFSDDDHEPIPTRCPEARRLRVWAIVCAYVLGFASAVALALVQPAKAAADMPPEITSTAGEQA